MEIEVAVVIQAANQLTARQAAEVLKGVGRIEGARAQLLDVDALGDGAYEWTALDKADAIVFGASTYLGAVPAGFRRLLEAAAKRRCWKDKLAGGFACTGSPNEESAGLRQLASIAEQHGMIWVEPSEVGDAETLGLRIAEAALRSKTLQEPWGHPLAVLPVEAGIHEQSTGPSALPLSLSKGERCNGVGATWAASKGSARVTEPWVSACG